MASASVVTFGDLCLYDTNYFVFGSGLYKVLDYSAEPPMVLLVGTLLPDKDVFLYRNPTEAAFNSRAHIRPVNIGVFDAKRNTDSGGDSSDDGDSLTSPT